MHGSHHYYICISNIIIATINIVTVTDTIHGLLPVGQSLCLARYPYYLI